MGQSRQSDRQPSRLSRVQHTLLDSPTLTETSDEGTENAPRSVLAGPSLPPNIGSSHSSAASPRTFGRSKTGIGLKQFTVETAAREVTVNAAQNFLTR